MEKKRGGSTYIYTFRFTDSPAIAIFFIGKYRPGAVAVAAARGP